jgi:hypothetical protein
MICDKIENEMVAILAWWGVGPIVNDCKLVVDGFKRRY